MYVFTKGLLSPFLFTKGYKFGSGMVLIDGIPAPLNKSVSSNTIIAHYKGKTVVGFRIGPRNYGRHY